MSLTITNTKNAENLLAYRTFLANNVDESVLEAFNLESIEYGFIQKYSPNEGKNSYINFIDAFERAECDDECFGITYDVNKKTYSLRKSKKITKYTEKVLENNTICEISILKDDLTSSSFVKEKERCNICGKIRIIEKTVVDIRKNFKDRTKRDKPFKTEVKFCKKCYKERLTRKEEDAKEEIDPEFATELEPEEVKELEPEEELVLEPPKPKKKKVVLKKKKPNPELLKKLEESGAFEE